ncbi:TIGR02556 family CRISPR-associated protein [Methanolobus bombayensis]|uniref:TIGR02556 family CRISPR-associated protein n=1 Tax=Methanolobus bombayensis TaxID=38023 RepID=UPI001AE3D44F|nr:TIGR02556 family CRISPR-associated protein [Methanolobus bombayensis]MBP1908272.1 CRISPR-associated protein Csh1 [Methanolobus bombayensis]
MIELVSNIGQVVRKTEGDKDLIDLWQKNEADDYEFTLIVNISNQKIDLDLKAFEKKIFKDGLFYQQGNWSIGSIIKINKFKDTKENKKKIVTKILRALDFLDISGDAIINEINNSVFSKVSEYENKSFVILFTKDSDLPINSLKYKFVEAIEDKGLKKTDYSGTCQICGTQSNGLYNSIVYKCFTNDKEIYSNTDSSPSHGICRECIYDILHGKSHVDKYLKTWWSGSEVLFLPHKYNADIKKIYEEYSINESNSTTLLSKIRENETDVLYEIGDCGALVDILFINDNKSNSEWKITYHIRNVIPSRFNKISNLEYKYKSKKGTPLTFYLIINYLLNGKIKKKEMFKTGEAKSFLKDIFYGNKLNRNLFFYRAMQKYRLQYFEDENNGRMPSLIMIHRIYNFLVDCGCLENGWNLVVENEDGDYSMSEYESIDDFFAKNSDFFSSDTKKAWFLLGRLYSNMIYESKKYKGGENNNNVESYLEKNFFFGRKYDFTTFVYLSNQCSELMHKYGVQNKIHLKNLASDTKGLMGSGLEKLSSDEAKYIFFWGMQQWIANPKDADKIAEGDEE